MYNILRPTFFADYGKIVDSIPNAISFCAGADPTQQQLFDWLVRKAAV